MVNSARRDRLCSARMPIPVHLRRFRRKTAAFSNTNNTIYDCQSGTEYGRYVHFFILFITACDVSSRIASPAIHPAFLLPIFAISPAVFRAAA